MSQIFDSLNDWQAVRAALGEDAKSIGFVPTMGALHAGHVSLLERARAENDIVVLSIFVNPTQFNDPRDLERYPRDLAADAEMTGHLADYILAPGTPATLYPAGYRYRVTESTLSARWEGAHRPGHFDGVLTVVMKLLNLVAPHRAYFGEKDWQQLELIRGMVRDFFMPVEIVACPTVRAPDGLALSSRNALLATDSRERAAQFPAVLRSAADAKVATTELRRAGFEVDYVDDHEGRRLGAVRCGGVRLIDNVRL